jgi:hypothetical protein
MVTTWEEMDSLGSMDWDAGPNGNLIYLTCYSVMMVIVAIVIEISTLMQKKWIRKAN